MHVRLRNAYDSVEVWLFTLARFVLPDRLYKRLEAWERQRFTRAIAEISACAAHFRDALAAIQKAESKRCD